MTGQQAETRTSVGRRRTNPLLATTRIIAISLLSLTLYWAYVFRQLFLRTQRERFHLACRFVHLWGRWACRIAGIEVLFRGRQPVGQMLVCPNHIGYVDILALASAFPAFFVSRADAADWPLVGRLIRRSEQVLVSRRRSRDLTHTTEAIALRLQAELPVVVFLEGTSTGGDRLLRFHPSLLQPALDTDTPILPLALQWSTKADGQSVADDLAYWGDHRFPFHLFRLMGLPGGRVEMVSGEPVSAVGMSRKEVAETVRRRVLELFDNAEFTDRR